MKKELAVAIAAARDAGKILMKKFTAKKPAHLVYKRYHELVLDADLASNELIVRRLTTAFPNDDVISEETAMIDKPGSRIWYVDPLDGTTNFAYGLPHFCVCIGLYTPRGITVGVINRPVQKEMFTATRGGGAWRGRERLHVSQRNRLEAAMSLTCGGYSPQGRREYIRFLRAMKAHHSRIRQFGSAGVDLASLAAGHADIVYLTAVRPWDVAAGVVLVREAGGLVTDRKGRPWEPGAQELLATNGRLHKNLLALLRS